MDLVCVGKKWDLNFEQVKCEKHTKCPSGDDDKVQGKLSSL